MYNQLEDTVEVDLSSQFAEQYEEYRKACRERYEQRKGKRNWFGNKNESEAKEEPISTTTTTTTTVTTTTTITTASVEDDEPELDVKDTSVLLSDANIETKEDIGIESTRTASQTSGRRPSKVLEFCSSIFKFKKEEVKQDRKSRKDKLKEVQEDERMAKLVERLELEGRSEEEIDLFLQDLQLAKEEAQAVPQPQPQPQPRRNSVAEGMGQFFRTIQQAVKEEMSQRRVPERFITIEVSTRVPYSYTGTYNLSFVNNMHMRPDIDMSYENLARLEPVCQGVKCLDHLPLTVFHGERLPSDQSTCAICLSEFEVDEELRSLTCVHYFHRECIDRWLSVSQLCPVCKNHIEG